MTKIISIGLILALVCLSSASWIPENHEYNGGAGKEVADAVKNAM